MRLDRAKKVVIDKENTTIFNGVGAEKEIDARATQIKARRDRGRRQASPRSYVTPVTVHPIVVIPGERSALRARSDDPGPIVTLRLAIDLSMGPGSALRPTQSGYAWPG